MKKLLKILFIFVLLFVSSLPSPAERVGKFKKLGNLTHLRNTPISFQSIILKDGRIVIYDEDEPNLETYDENTQQISYIPIPDVHIFAKIVALDDGRFVILGSKCRYLFSDPAKSYEDDQMEYAQIYDPKTKSWSDGAKMNYPRQRYGVVKLKDGRLFIYGGQTLNRDFQTKLSSGDYKMKYTDALYAEIYDPKTDKFTVAAKAPKIEKRIQKLIKSENGEYRPYSEYQKMVDDRNKEIEEAKKPKYKQYCIHAKYDKKGNRISCEIKNKLIKQPVPPPLPEIKPIEIPEYFGGTRNIELLENGEVIAYYPDKDYAEIYNSETNEFRVVPYSYKKAAEYMNSDIKAFRKKLEPLAFEGLNEKYQLYMVELAYKACYSWQADYWGEGKFIFPIDDRNLYVYDKTTKKISRAGKYPLRNRPKSWSLLPDGRLLVIAEDKKWYKRMYDITLFMFTYNNKYKK